ncbi:hypothetical protein niasHS_014738 [Heterodera schachtii]|uniref:PIN domain-containing protein n=1 Tax=Heterodera schachtii TaxID=97005 RepID=A0ABD2IN97_HETSC
MPSHNLNSREGQSAAFVGKSTTAEECETLRKSLEESIRKLVRSPSEKAAKRILSLSVSLAQLYADGLLNNLEQKHRTNAEQELWKVCFYSAVEALRKQSGSAGPHSSVFRRYLLNLVQQAIDFYEELLDKYERKFGVNFSSYSRWPSNENGFPSEDLADCSISNSDPPVHDTNVLRSAQRHLIYLGDLHRYKVQNQQETMAKDFSEARRFYLRASSLELLNGHPFNQLAVIAFYEKTPVEMLFWYVRALSVRVPFEPARDSIETVLNNFRGPAVNFERWIWEQMESKENEMRGAQKKGLNGAIPNGEKRGKDGVRPRSKYIREVWIRPREEADKGEGEADAEGSGRICEGRGERRTDGGAIGRIFVGEQAKKNQKQAVQHILNTAGILISNIGTEQFKRSAECLLMELTAFVATDAILLTPLKFLQIMLIYAFPALSAKTGASQALVAEQKQSAFSTILNILERFLEMICDDIDQIGLFLLTGKLSKKFSRVLPSVCFVLNWLCVQQSLHSEFSSQLPLNDRLWHLFSVLCNNLQRLREGGELFECSLEHCKQHDRVNVLLPELVVASPFFKVLPKNPSAICFRSLPDENLSDLQFLAVHARFGLLLLIGKRFASDEGFTPLIFGLHGFESVPFELVPTATDFGENHLRRPLVAEEVADSLATESTSSRELSTSADESELKKKLLMDEQSSFTHHWIIEIRPKYLVPDTNTFIDHLGHIQRLVQSDQFTVLVPTIVIDELNCLALGAPIPPGSTLLSRELLTPEGSKAAVVMQRAKTAMEWLREMANSRRNGRISTATSNGNILHKLTFAIDGSTEQFKKRSNDDLILSVCVRLCDKLEKVGGGGAAALSSVASSAESTKLERTVVLLTEDRGLSAKAEAEKIPVRTMQSFVRWALTPEEGQTKRNKGTTEGD